MIRKKILFASLLLVVFLSSCKKEKEVFDTDDINHWIYGEMDAWYLWTDQLPSSPDYQQSPENFYESLLYREEDRFSFYYPDYEVLINALNGVSLDPGFEFKAYLDGENSQDVIGVIVYVKPGSPADLEGLRRGDVFTEVNGTPITSSNYQALRAQMQGSFSLTFERYDFNNEEFVDQGKVTITPIEFAENPFFLDSIYNLDGTKVGYLVYNFFATGPTDRSTEYEQQMDEIFGRFKSHGVAELIIDLRFNSGGTEVSVRSLSSLIVPSAGKGNYVIKKQYNDELQDYLLNNKNFGSDHVNIKFLDMANNLGDQLSGQRVFFITSDWSASASEATMNALKPFMELKVIGDTTTGKDVGSTTLYDERENGNRIGLQPIIVRITNNNNEGYPEGFQPDVAIEDNFRILYPLGDIGEPLLQAALNEIDPQPARVALPKRAGTQILSSQKERGLQVESSFDR